MGVNGVYRGGCGNMYDYVVYKRCAIRRANQKWSGKDSVIGFRLNGVIRGAGLGYANAFRVRVGFRLTGYNFKYSSVSDLGFRLCKLFHVEQR